MNIFYGFLKHYFTNKFPAFYSSLLGIRIRNFFGKKIELRNQKIVGNYINTLISENIEKDIDHNCFIFPKKKFENQNIIWQFWWQGIEFSILPPLAKLSYKSVDKFKGEFQVIRLDKNSVLEYLSIPDFVFEKVNSGQFSITSFSDLLRLSLLYYYGGIWIDSTIILTKEIDKKYLHNDYFFFQRIEIRKDLEKVWIAHNRFYFGWDTKHKINIMNGFFYSKKYSYDVYIMLKLLFIHWYKEDSIKHYFLFQILVHELKYKNLIKCNFLVEDDTLPHLLLLELKNTLNQEVLKSILTKINIHVFRHNIPVYDNSFYEHIIKMIDKDLLCEFKK